MKHSLAGGSFRQQRKKHVYTHVQQPHKWNKAKDGACCIACEEPFRRGDKVLSDCAVTLHADCKEKYRQQLKELGLSTNR